MILSGFYLSIVEYIIDKSSCKPDYCLKTYLEMLVFIKPNSSCDNKLLTVNTFVFCFSFIYTFICVYWPFWRVFSRIVPPVWNVSHTCKGFEVDFEHFFRAILARFKLLEMSGKPMKKFIDYLVFFFGDWSWNVRNFSKLSSFLIFIKMANANVGHLAVYVFRWILRYKNTLIGKNLVKSQ